MTYKSSFKKIDKFISFIRSDHLYKNAIFLIFSSSISAIYGFIFWIIAARIYSPEEVGLTTATISAAGMITILSTLGLNYGVVRFLPIIEKNRRTDIINSCITASGLTATIILIIFLGGLSVWSPVLLPYYYNKLWLILFILLTLMTVYSEFICRIFISIRKSNLVFLQNLIVGISRFLPLIVLSKIYSGVGILTSWTLAISVSVVFCLFFVLPKIEERYKPIPMIDRKLIREIIPFSMANYINDFLWNMPFFILPLMIANTLSIEQTAYFYIAWSAASVLFIISQSISYSLFSEGSHKEETLRYASIKSLKFNFYVLIPLLIIVLLLSDKLLLIFGSNYSENATNTFRVISLSSIPICITQIFFAKKRVERKNRDITILSLISLVTIIGLSYHLLPLFGTLGGGFAWLIGRFVILILIISVFEW